MKPDWELTADELQAKYDALASDSKWGEHPYFSKKEWQQDVAAYDTRLGYWDWVHHNIETAEFDEQPDEEVEEGSYRAWRDSQKDG